MDTLKLKSFVNTLWEDAVLPSLTEYIRIPNKSPAFDREWAAHGYMDDAIKLMEAWARARLPSLKGATLEVVRLPNRTPVILIEVPGDTKDTVLLYGHMDKQPEFTGWEEGLGPWTPVRRGDRLYGRGSADDGYAIYGALSALLALHDQRVQHARAVVLIEASEESGSIDLPYYVDHLASRIGKPSLVVCLDSGCGDYDRLWLTTSLRGTAIGTLTVKVLKGGVHSGDASGIVPSSFRIARQLLSRIEDEKTGQVIPRGFHVDIPPARVAQAKAAAQIVGKEAYAKFPFVGRTRPMADDPAELILNRTWRPQLAVIGADGLPVPANAGATLLPSTQLKLSLRMPPTLDSDKGMALLSKLLTEDPPYDAEITWDPLLPNNSGWNAPELAPWLETSVKRAGQAAFGQPTAFMGEGGTIPFMAMLGAKFPETQFAITGLLGPDSNAHGPNEFLHIPTGKRLSETVALVLADHAQRAS